MSSWGLQVEAFQSQTLFGFPGCYPLAFFNFPATFIFASLPAEGGWWLVSLHLGLLLPSLTPWYCSQDCGFEGQQPLLLPALSSQSAADSHLQYSLWRCATAPPSCASAP